MKFLSVFAFAFFAVNAEAALSIKVNDNSGQPVEGVVVYLTNEQGVYKKMPVQKPLVINQSDKKFAPYITVVQKGNAVEFENNDDITHHIYSAIGKNKFSFKLTRESDPKLVEFKHAGEVPMGCNIHDWMSGHVLVLDTPRFDQTNKTGDAAFAIENDGNWYINIWHPQLSKADKLETRWKLDANKNSYVISLKDKMAPIPEQKGLDDFDFLDGY